MLSENIKAYRKAKGLSQQELAIKLNVVRQTVSKWEKGLSVPDSEMLLLLAETLDVSVSVLLGESLSSEQAPTLQSLAEKLEILKGLVDSNIEKLDERRGILHSRRHLAASPVFKGIPHFRDVRVAMLRAEGYDELMSIIDGINLENHTRDGVIATDK